LYADGRFQLPAPRSDVAALRRELEAGVAATDGVTLQFELTELARTAALVAVNKLRVTAEFGLRLRYQAVVVLLLPVETLRLELDCVERDEPTGLRGAQVYAELMRRDSIKHRAYLASRPVAEVPAGVDYATWSRSQPLVVDFSDDAEWDPMFVPQARADAPAWPPGAATRQLAARPTLAARPRARWRQQVSEALGIDHGLECRGAISGPGLTAAPPPRVNLRPPALWLSRTYLKTVLAGS